MKSLQQFMTPARKGWSWKGHFQGDVAAFLVSTVPKFWVPSVVWSELREERRSCFRFVIKVIAKKPVKSEVIKTIRKELRTEEPCIGPVMDFWSWITKFDQG